jgi:hypothetical protein
VLTNRLVPNRFRIRARVRSLFSRGLSGNETFVQKHCGHCRRSFDKPYCTSCNDTSLTHAAMIYRFIALLESSPSDAKQVTLPVIIADDDAEAFLPPLPPLDGSTNPNDMRKKEKQVQGCCDEVEKVLMGGKVDGERVRPVIEWGVESLVLRPPGQGKGKGKGNGKMGAGKEGKVVVYRVMGMTLATSVR